MAVPGAAATNSSSSPTETEGEEEATVASPPKAAERGAAKNKSEAKANGTNLATEGKGSKDSVAVPGDRKLLERKAPVSTESWADVAVTSETETLAKAAPRISMGPGV